MPPQTATSAAEFLPDKLDLPHLRDASEGCRGCDLYERGTQTVFGEGTTRAEVMFVGEQPGDKEDLEGKPFVGPAGRLLDEALTDAGIDRTKVYVTNIVKHFKWEPRGKRRIHKKPNMKEITACKPWLDAEVEVVKPKVIVCLGSTAAQGLLGRGFRVTKQRGELFESDAEPGVTITATVHPSSILRAPDDETRKLEMKHFTDDLARVARRLEEER